MLITFAGVSYVSANYVGLFKGLFGGSACTVHADFTDSGGIFSNAEVTYRGVAIGRVGAIHLHGDGVRVDLNIDSCSSAKVPTDTAAAVSDRSVIGEQYVNLIPPNGKGPYFKGGEVIPVEPHHDPGRAEGAAQQLRPVRQLRRHRPSCASSSASSARRSTTAARISAACSTRTASCSLPRSRTCPRRSP